MLLAIAVILHGTFYFSRIKWETVRTTEIAELKNMLTFILKNRKQQNFELQQELVKLTCQSEYSKTKLKLIIK